MSAPTSVCARYKAIYDWHIFISDDLPGLYVASKDAARALNDVAPAIEKLLWLDEGVKCRAVPEVSLAEFLEMLKDESRDKDRPLVMSDKRYFVEAAVAA